MNTETKQQSNTPGVILAAIVMTITLAFCFTFMGVPAAYTLGIPLGIVAFFGFVHLTVWMVLLSIKLHTRRK